MIKNSGLSVPVHDENVDEILAGIDQARYLDAVQSSCTSLAAGHIAESLTLSKVYLYVRPEYVVAKAFAEGNNPSVALAEWHDAVRRMLAEFRTCRRKSLLFEVMSAAGYSGIELPLDLAGIDFALATLTVFRSEGVKPTLDELEASSIPLEGWDQSPCPDLSNISKHFHRILKTNAELERENSRIKSELDRKMKQLRQFESEREELRGKITELGEENELLLLQFHQVQEELEQYYLKLQAMSLKDDRDDTQLANPEPSSLAPSQPVKTKKRSAFVRKIATLKRLRSESALLKSTQLFDSVWYLQHYPDVAAAKMDPIRHYLRFGAVEGRNPGPDFNSEGYLRRYPDVAETGVNPLVHYLKYGKHEGRSKSDWSWN
jgi:hypothetical protein